MFSLWLTYGDDFHFMPSIIENFIFPWDKISSQDKMKLKNLYIKFEKQLPTTLSFKLNSNKNVGTYNVRKLWHITDESDLIFLKYLSSNPIKTYQLIENFIASSVISDKN